MTQNQGRIIGISGKQFAGKDVLADLLLAALPTFRKIPLALAIKQAYGEKHGLNLAEIERDKPKHRPGLIALGDWGRAQDPDYWLKQVLTLPGDKIIPDVRLRREHDLLRRHGAFLIRLEADRDVRARRGTIVSEADRTECDLDDMRDWDAIVTNNTVLSALQAQVDELVRRLA